MIRPAGPADVPMILTLIHELAAYERAPDEVRATEQQLQDALFGPDAVASCLLATSDARAGEDGAVVGFALWFRTFSTWNGTASIYLEDLFVQAGRAGRRSWPGAAHRARRHRRRAWLRPGRVVGAELERAGSRFLPPARRRPAR